MVAETATMTVFWFVFLITKKVSDIDNQRLNLFSVWLAEKEGFEPP